VSVCPHNEWLTLSDLAAAVERDKALISRFVAKHQIETRRGPNRAKLVNVAQYRRVLLEEDWGRHLGVEVDRETGLKAARYYERIYEQAALGGTQGIAAQRRLGELDAALERWVGARAELVRAILVSKLAIKQIAAQCPDRRGEYYYGELLEHGLNAIAQEQAGVRPAWLLARIEPMAVSTSSEDARRNRERLKAMSARQERRNDRRRRRSSI
jgi:hypothetical protein